MTSTFAELFNSSNGILDSSEPRNNMKYMLHTLSDNDLITIYQSNLTNTKVVEILLEKYFPLLKKLDLANQQKHPLTTFDDNLQNARLGAIIAFQRFNTKSGTKLFTFLYTTVYYHLLSCNDQESFIHFPSNLRKFKSALGGKYDDNEFLKNKILNQYTVDSIPDCITEVIPETPIGSENETISDIYSGLFLDSLPEDERIVAELLIQGHTISKIANVFSEKYHKPYSHKQINKKIAAIQAAFSV